MTKILHNWYIAIPGLELFLDFDAKTKPQIFNRLRHARARLRGAKRQGKLDWEAYYIYQSQTAFHYHLMVKLNNQISPIEQILWESRFCDDMYRNNMNFARYIVGGRSWSLLITPQERRSYWRPPDYVCSCPSKHKAEVMRDCPIAKKLNCVLTADHFGDPIDEKDDFVFGRACTW